MGIVTDVLNLLTMKKYKITVIIESEEGVLVQRIEKHKLLAVTELNKVLRYINLL